MVIAVDFDGTCVTHAFPNVGKEIGAPKVLKKLVEKGHQLILWTMRSDRAELGETSTEDIKDEKGLFLTDAINWFKSHDIPLYGIQTHPTQHHWTTSPKCYSQLLIDDTALGCPLKFSSEISNRHYVDWDHVEDYLIQLNLI
jgi:hypothetical protein